ncbi:MAG: hypothetical protein CMC51_06425 [Flavobacteriaceae bacterium]|nr:hypothetical protein [Flavobacteriaceae bacterium]|tara:strand:- start:28503 stop:28916 length:414 start_codon:yes stop_codon:yes gene_type:complete
MERKNYKLIYMYRYSILFLLLFSCFSNNNDLNIISNIEFSQYSKDDITLIDVRTLKEFETGFIENAINIDFYSNSISSKISLLDKDSKFVIYCRSDNRSTKFAKLLLESGFKDVNVIKGGMIEWVKSGNDLIYPNFN